MGGGLPGGGSGGSSLGQPIRCEDSRDVLFRPAEGLPKFFPSQEGWLEGADLFDQFPILILFQLGNVVDRQVVDFFSHTKGFSGGI